jgi:hypothetical protein
VNRIEQFEHNKQTYEIRAVARDNGYEVRTYLDNKQVSPTYSISFETAIDFTHSGWGSAVDNLIQDAQSDITEGRLDELAKALASK